MKKQKLLLVTGFCTIMILAAGCGGLLDPKPDPTRFYVLKASTPETPMPKQKNNAEIAIGIRPVAIPGYLDRPQLVTRVSNNEVHLSEWNRWASPIGQSIAEILGENFALLLGTSKITIYPCATVAHPQYDIWVSILNFDGRPGDTIKLDCRWRITNEQNEKVFAVKDFHAELPCQNTHEGYAEAMSKVLGMLSREIASEILVLSSDSAPMDTLHNPQSSSITSSFKAENNPKQEN